jgi:hypothetical protein
MQTRAASLFLALSFAFICLPAHAQGPANNLNARVAALEAAVAALQNNINSEAADRAAADTALAARVGKLEGNITAADLVGTYTFVFFDVPLSAAKPFHNATIETDAITATVTLNADGTLTLGASPASFTNCGSTLTQGLWTLTAIPCGTDPPPPGTWSYANGIASLSIFGDGDVKQFGVAVGGRLLTASFVPFHVADQSSDAVLVILSRLQ